MGCLPLSQKNSFLNFPHPSMFCPHSLLLILLAVIHNVHWLLHANQFRLYYLAALLSLVSSLHLGNAASIINNAFPWVVRTISPVHFAPYQVWLIQTDSFYLADFPSLSNLDIISLIFYCTFISGKYHFYEFILILYHTDTVQGEGRS